MPEADDPRALQRDFALAEAAVREAGTLAHAYYEAAPDAWEKHDSSPVSEADHAVDALLHRRLIGNRPSYGWISEESPKDDARHQRERVWIVDPIDGTRAFLARRPDWVVSVALAIAGKPVFGLLFNPLRREFLAAIRGAGATLNDVPIHVGRKAEIEGCRMLSRSSRLASHRWRQPWPEMEVSHINSFAYQIAMVASDRADATIAFARIHEWDLAAADVILTEAGGRLTDGEGAPVIYNSAELRRAGAVAANARLHAALIDFIAGNGHNDGDAPGR